MPTNYINKVKQKIGFVLITVLLCFISMFALYGCQSTNSTQNQNANDNTNITNEPVNTEEKLNQNQQVASNENTAASENEINENTTVETSTQISGTKIVDDLGDNTPFWIQFIDVGQADAALVQSNGHYMLIDGGNRGDSDTIYAVLERNQIDTLDAVISSHTHEDHCGGLPAAFNATNVSNFYYDGSSATSKIWSTVMDNVKAEGITPIVPNTGDNFMLGDAKVEFVNIPGDYEDENDNSLVVKITYGDTSFLFTGDASHDAEIAMTEANPDILDVDVLKVGHHGSDTATSYPFLRAVMPEIAVISVGEGNSYGHPTEEVLSRLEDAEVEIYRTDQLGDIIVQSNGTQIAVSAEKH